MRTVNRGERGSSLPETAIIIGVVLAVLLGIIDFGRAMYTYAYVAQLARQGARWAIVRGSQCTVLDHCNAQSSDVQTYVQSLSVGATVSTHIQVSATWPSSGCPPGYAAKSPGCVVVVTVTYPFAFVAPLVSVAKINMSSTSQMVISQ